MAMPLDPGGGGGGWKEGRLIGTLGLQNEFANPDPGGSAWGEVDYVAQTVQYTGMDSWILGNYRVYSETLIKKSLKGWECRLCGSKTAEDFLVGLT